MTSRYALYETDKIRDRFAPSSATPKGVKPRYNISPAMRVPVIVSREGELQIKQMIWGFVPIGAKDTNSIFRYKTYAVRSEKLLETHTYRTALRSLRCIIPTNGFYKWKKTAEGKKPFYISLNSGDVFGFAGIYSEWVDANGASHGICAVLTIDTETDDNKIPSRLPVTIDQIDEAEWLNPKVSDLSTLFRIIRPSDTSTLKIIPVSDDVNSTKIDGPHLIDNRHATK